MSQFIERTFPRLIELIYAAALDPSAWQDFLNALTEPFGGSNGVLYACDKRHGVTDFNFNYGTDPAFHASYVSHYYKINPYGMASLGLKVGKVLPASYAADLRKVEASDFFNEWMKPQGITADHLAVLVRNNAREHVVLGVAPNAPIFYRHRERYTQELSMLVPHITRALTMNEMVEKAQATSHHLDGVLESYNAAAMLLVRGRPDRINSVAARLIDAGLFRIGRYGILTTGRPEDESRFNSAVDRALKASSAMPVGPVEFVSRRDGTAYYAWFTSLPPQRQGRDAAEEIASNTFGSILILISTLGQMTVAPEAIENALLVSPAEARLASAIVGGSTITQYAQRAGLSRNTVRNQLASIFTKTGTSRQAELVTLIASLLPSAGRGAK